MHGPRWLAGSRLHAYGYEKAISVDESSRHAYGRWSFKKRGCLPHHTVLTYFQQTASVPSPVARRMKQFKGSLEECFSAALALKFFSPGTLSDDTLHAATQRIAAHKQSPILCRYRFFRDPGSICNDGDTTALALCALWNHEKISKTEMCAGAIEV